MKKGRAKRIGIVVGVVGLVVYVTSQGDKRSIRRKAESGPEPTTGATVSHGGTLLGGTPEKGGSPVRAGAPSVPGGKSGAEPALEPLLKRVSETSLNPKVETALRGAGGGKVAKDLALYLRMRQSKTPFTADESRVLESSVMVSLVQNSEEALDLAGRALSAIEPDAENRASRMDLLNLAARVPARENPEISRNALATLAEIYTDSGVRPEERFDLAVTGLQAFLATTSADPAQANAAVARAMGGRIDPAVQGVFQNMVNDRYPAR